MKIYRENSYLNHINTIKSNNQPTANITQKRNSRNFDTITISSKQAMDETAFSKELSHRLLKEVSSPTNAKQHKIEELKTQVQSGNYPIIIDDIAKKMLFF